MRFPFPGSAAWIVVLAAFAGCVEEDGESSGRGDLGMPPEAAFGEGEGSIVGEVVDEAQLPVANATVGIVELQINARGDEEGRFALNNVPSGEYTTFATALGYEQAGQRVTVTEGQVTEGVVFVLPPMPSDEPYSVVDIQRVQLTGILWKVTPECIYTDVDPLVKTCGGLRTAGCDNCEVNYDADNVTAEWKTIFGEVAWTPQSGVSGRGFSYDVNAPNITRGSGGSINQADSHTWVVDTDEPPIQIRIDNPETLEERGIPESDWYPYPDNDCTAPDPDDVGNCDWFWRIFPAHCDLGNCKEGFGPDVGVMSEGIADVYFTYFIREPAPDGYSSLPEE